MDDKTTPATPETPALSLVPAPTDATAALGQNIEQVFAFERTHTITPRGGQPVTVIVRPFYVDQLFPIIETVERVFTLAKSLATPEGDVDLFKLFMQGREDVLVLLAQAIERDRNAFVGRLELDDLLLLFSDVFHMNKDFFEQRVKERMTAIIESISSTL